MGMWGGGGDTIQPATQAEGKLNTDPNNADLTEMDYFKCEAEVLRAVKFKYRPTHPPPAQSWPLPGRMGALQKN